LFFFFTVILLLQCLELLVLIGNTIAQNFRVLHHRLFLTNVSAHFFQVAFQFKLVWTIQMLHGLA